LGAGPPPNAYTGFIKISALITIYIYRSDHIIIGSSGDSILLILWKPVERTKAVRPDTKGVDIEGYYFYPTNRFDNWA